MRLIIALLFSFTMSAQTLLTETFNNFEPTLHDSTKFSLNLTNTADSLTLDQTSTIPVAITINGWASYQALVDSLNGSNPFRPGGTAVQWKRADGYLSYGVGEADALDMSASGVTVVFIGQNWRQITSTSTQQGMFNFRQDLFSSEAGYQMRLRGGAPYNGMFTRAGDGTNFVEDDCDASIATSLNDSSWNIFAAVWGTNYQKMYVNGAQVGTGTGTLTPPVNHTRPYYIGAVMTGGSNTPVTGLYWTGRVGWFLVIQDQLTQAEIEKIGFLPNGWETSSANVGLVRPDSADGFKFCLGVNADTVYYNTALTAGNWTVTLSDSAASGVAYQVLTSADKTTWTTLASGTTGTSWGSKSYSGAGTGYVAIAVASGTAFFDDLVVTLASDDKNGFGGYSGKYKGWGKY